MKNKKMNRYSLWDLFIAGLLMGIKGFFEAPDALACFGRGRWGVAKDNIPAN